MNGKETQQYHIFFRFYSFEDISMECNQNSNPLDYSQSSVVYKEINANNIPVTTTIPPNLKSNEHFDQNVSMKTSALGQVIL